MNLRRGNHTINSHMLDIIRIWQSQVLANSIIASFSAHQVFKLTVNIHVAFPQLHVIDNLGMEKEISLLNCCGTITLNPNP